MDSLPLPSLINRYRTYIPATSFTLGFLFDIVTLDRIDSSFGIIQQALYLLVIGALLFFELLEREGHFTPSPSIQKIWKYREPAIHFLLGALLSVYMLFYFKSSSFFASFFFLLFIAGLLIANEFEAFQRFGIRLRIALFSLCTVSFFLILVPVVLGFIGVVPFVLSMIASFFLCHWSFHLLKKRQLSFDTIRKELIYPSSFIHFLFITLYFFKILPPVPLSVTYMGVYHGVEKKEGQYHLTHHRPWWRFWHHGDQWYYLRSGDTLYGFASVFSPAKFKDTVVVRWLLYSPKQGWQTQDKIPFEIVGGRDLGYRGYTAKKSFSPGEWRFQIETSDEREIGRLYFKVYEDTSTDAREERVDVF